MKNPEILLTEILKKSVKELYDTEATDSLIQIQKTRKEFEGDYTIVTFPFAGIAKKSPENIGNEIGDFVQSQLNEVKTFNVIKGFLNISFTNAYWLSYLNQVAQEEETELVPKDSSPQRIIVEYSSPNTNKPLHLGHIRNNLLGYSVSNILEAKGNTVTKVQIINDRGIHITKTMVAWRKWGQNETPQSSGTKGDHLVGKYYVMFENEYKKQVSELINAGYSKQTAQQEAPLLKEAREMLQRWENDDPEVTDLWKKMNNWVYEGFNQTYANLGVTFDKNYYESNTYKLGKEIIRTGRDNNVVYTEGDGSNWADLSGYGLDEKLLLRSDGTSVYITQDIGLAVQRKEEYHFDKHIYVVGNEQNYHFQALSAILNKLGYQWADQLFHLAYGMVELPDGKMKSREGTVVDADDLIQVMRDTAEETSKNSNKIGDLAPDEADEIYRIVAMGALKYFILKVDPKKNMVFNPDESIDFNGNTGPFIQYSYARIQSVLRKATARGYSIPVSLDENQPINEKEKQLIKQLYLFNEAVEEASSSLNPSAIANYTYELAREFNQFYHDYSILRADSEEQISVRLLLAQQVGKTIKQAFGLLGIEVPRKM